MNVAKIAEEYRERLLSYRRQLHQNPELSFEEVNTAAWIRGCLMELDIPILEGVRGNSTVGILKGDEPGPTLLFRADIDALPVMEETDLEFKSKIPGVMHACGHDAHTATLMCMADFLSKHRELVKGTVKFVFQQGEDKLPGGGKLIVEDGVLSDVDYVFSWHCCPHAEVGTIILEGGPATASFDSFEIHIRGKGGHAGFPHNAIDPVSTGALVVTALNQLLPWEVGPLDSATLIVSRINAGHHGVYNVVAEEMVIEGNVRSLNNETAQLLLRRIKETSENICKAKECSCEFISVPGYPALYNDQALTERLKKKLIQAGVQVVSADPIMGAEDFAYYTQVKPGVYFQVGTRNSADPRTAYTPHNPHFCIDESAMVYALRTLLETYLELV